MLLWTRIVLSFAAGWARKAKSWFHARLDSSLAKPTMIGRFGRGRCLCRKSSLLGGGTSQILEVLFQTSVSGREFSGLDVSRVFLIFCG